MTDNKETIISKIQKLLEVTEAAGATPDEAATAAALASKLMVKYAVEQAELQGRQVVEAKMVTAKVDSLYDRKTAWEDYLAYEVSKMTFTHCFWTAGKAFHTFCGQQMDVEVAVYTYATLRAQLTTMSRLKLSEHGRAVKEEWGKSIYNPRQCREYSGCHPTVYRSRWLISWLDGAGSTVRGKIQRAVAEAKQEQANALMVIEQRTEKAAHWATETFKLVKSKEFKAQKRFADAKEQGRRDGQAIELRHGLTVSDTPKLEGR